MTQKQNIRLLLAAGLCVVSLGGWLLHVRIHPVSSEAINWIPFLTGLVSIIILPAMFLSKKTLPYAYIINGMLVIIGTITMAHVSVPKLVEQFSFGAIFIGTLLADIAILWVNFFIGKSIFELEMFKVMDAAIRKGRFFRYPNMGYWAVHVVTLSAVYVLGFLLWK